MMVARSQAEPELIHVLLTDAEAAALRDALKGRKSELRRRLKEVLRGK